LLSDEYLKPEAPTVAIIPARAGSKRIPGKNIKPFLGTPLISRTIETVVQSEIFDRVVVSTDGVDIAETAMAVGADVPFVRPSELSDDFATTDAVIRHAIEQVESEGATLGFVCVVYPAAILATVDDFRRSYNLLRDGLYDFVFTATSFPYPIQRALRRHDDGSCEMFQPAELLTRSQDLEDAFHDAGQFYWGLRDAWVAGKAVFTSRSLMYELPRHRVQDIDTPEDWERAELLFRLLEMSDAS